MVFKLDVNYSEEELKFIREHNCNILDKIKLSKTDFSENEYPRRVFQYGSAYIAEIPDNESDGLVWTVLGKWKGIYHISSIYDSLASLEHGL